MGITKSNIFSAKQNELANTCKALAHPARIAILEYILKQSGCICNDLVAELGLAQATISQHLKVLKDVHIIKGDIEGTHICYCINTEIWQKIKSDLNLFFIEQPPIHNCC